MIEKLRVPVMDEDRFVAGTIIDLIKKVNELIERENARTHPFAADPKEPKE